MATKINIERWNNLKTKVKAEVQKRNLGTAPVDSYAGTDYDYSTSPAQGVKILQEVYEKNIIPLAAVNDSTLPTLREGLGAAITEADILAMETLVANLETFSNSPQSTNGGGCKASCTGYCQASCHGSCSTTCTGGCSNTCTGTCSATCANSCFTGCTGCTSCSGSCDGTCKGSCTGCTSCSGGCEGSCTAFCFTGCQGEFGAFCACCYDKTSASGGTAKGAVSAGYLWYVD